MPAARQGAGWQRAAVPQRLARVRYINQLPHLAEARDGAEELDRRHGAGVGAARGAEVLQQLVEHDELRRRERRRLGAALPGPVRALPLLLLLLLLLVPLLLPGLGQLPQGALAGRRRALGALQHAGVEALGAQQRWLLLLVLRRRRRLCHRQRRQGGSRRVPLGGRGSRASSVVVPGTAAGRGVRGDRCVLHGDVSLQGHACRRLRPWIRPCCRSRSSSRGAGHPPEERRRHGLRHRAEGRWAGGRLRGPSSLLLPLLLGRTAAAASWRLPGRLIGCARLNGSG